MDKIKVELTIEGNNHTKKSIEKDLKEVIRLYYLDKGERITSLKIIDDNNT